jgi:tripartite-type tricarboxylate transporter receptor subunit TctC
MLLIRLIAASLLCLPLPAQPQSYPSKPVRLIVPYVAGGAGDTIARAVGIKLAESLGQPVIVENRPGANAVIGSDYVANSAPDGYTLLLPLGPSHHTIQFFQKNVPYDPVKDFTPIMIVGTAPQIIVAGPALSVNTLAELIAYGKKNPGKLSFGTSGVGSSQHLGGLLLNSAAGLDLVHVPYKGGAAALNDVLGGQVPVGIVVLSNTLQHIKAGKLKGLAVIEARRAKGAPNIPTVAEGGVPGYAVPPTWAGILGPAGLPAPIVSRLSGELAKIAASPDVRSRLEAAGFEVTGSTPQEFAQILASSVEVYRKIVTEAGITPE